MAARRLPVPFGSQVYLSRHAAVAARGCVNMHAQATPADSKAPLALLRNEGIADFCDTAAGAVRGLHDMNGQVFVVAGQRLYSIAASGVATDRGAIPGAGRVSMDDNGLQLVVVNAAGEGFVWDGGTLAQISDPDFAPTGWVTFFDQYMIFGRLDGSGFALSALADATDFDALDVATPESSPDDLIAGLKDGRELLLFGTKSVEPWYNSGAADFPFERSPSGVIDVGCAARYSPARGDNGTYWLAREDGGLSVRRLLGGNPVRISTPDMDDLLDGFGSVSDAYGLAFTFAGHAYYVLTLPTAGWTFAYDAATQLWTQRRSKNRTTWRPSCVVGGHGRLLVGDSLTGKVGVMSRDAHTEWGDEILWETVCPPVQFERRMLTFNRLEVEIDAGQGLATGQGSDPVMYLSWSDDDGRTWSNEYERSMGVMGRFKQRCVWTNLGSARTRLFRLRGSEPIKTGLVAAFADVTVGA